ncbi:MAG TPA: hypothetical protein VF072_13340 [Thermoleophilaceae bacterium]
MSPANTIPTVHLRRALLLFAIVLGMAALVASLSRPVAERRDRTAQETTQETTPESGPPVATPKPGPAEPTGGAPRTVTFEASGKESRRVEAGTAVTVEVAVSEAGTVDIPDLGLTSPADPVTPARFDVLATRPGRYPVLFTPAAGEQSEPAGSLVVTSHG